MFVCWDCINMMCITWNVQEQVVFSGREWARLETLPDCRTTELKLNLQSGRPETQSCHVSIDFMRKGFKKKKFDWKCSNTLNHFFFKPSPERVTRSLPVALSLGITAPPPASTNSMLTSSRNPVLESGEERGTEKGEVWKRRKRSGPLEVTGGTWPPRQNLISCGWVWTNPEPGDPEPSTMLTWSPTPSHSPPTPRLESVCDWLKLKYKLSSDWSLPDHTSPWLVHQSKLCQNPADWWWQEPEKENHDFLSSFLCK